MSQQPYYGYGPYGAPPPYGVYAPYGAYAPVNNGQANKGNGNYQPYMPVSGNGNQVKNNPYRNWTSRNNHYNSGSGNTNKQQNIENQSGGTNNW